MKAGAHRSQHGQSRESLPAKPPQGSLSVVFKLAETKHGFIRYHAP